MSSDTSILIHNARVWPSVDAGLIDGGSVLVRDGRIEKVGRFHARAHTMIDAGGAKGAECVVQGEDAHSKPSAI